MPQISKSTTSSQVKQFPCLLNVTLVSILRTENEKEVNKGTLKVNSFFKSLFVQIRTVREQRKTVKIQTLPRSKKFKASLEAGSVEEDGSKLLMNTLGLHMQRV